MKVSKLIELLGKVPEYSVKPNTIGNLALYNTDGVFAGYIDFTGENVKLLKDARSLEEIKSQKYLTCEYCGQIGEDVFETVNPHEHEINDVFVKITVCENCYDDLCNDI